MSIATKCTCGNGGYCLPNIDGCRHKLYIEPPVRRMKVTSCYDCPFRNDSGWDGELDICVVNNGKGGTIIPHG